SPLSISPSLSGMVNFIFFAVETLAEQNRIEACSPSRASIRHESKVWPSKSSGSSLFFGSLGNLTGFGNFAGAFTVGLQGGAASLAAFDDRISHLGGKQAY